MTEPNTILDIDSPYPVTQEAIESFHRDGFVKLKNVLSPDAIAYYGQVISQKVIELNTMHLPMAERTVYQKAFLKIMNLWQQGGATREFVYGKRMARTAAELMGVGGVRLYHDQAFYKEPGGGITPWRADAYDWPMSNDKACTAWIPLQQTSMDMGPLEFAAGSHTFVYKHEQDNGEESQARIKATLELKGFVYEVSPYDLGEVSFHHGAIFHGADGNETDRPRAAMTIIYMDAGMRLKAPENGYQQVNWYTWFPGAKIGEVIDTPLNPILYQS